MFIKIMGSENMPDHDSNKSHTIIEVSEYSVSRGFVSNDGNPLDPSSLAGDVFISYQYEGRNYERRVFSNIYIMNRDGKTINAITPTPGVPQ